ncbi:ABC transporter permease/M1 family aminopeptidase [Clostridium manihotivorum]|uniref:Uncharacterized protein n=1 Tax=Clostridium manihotivorum TaxID=2320868 RepID=A0A3R5TF00_9CLOT|nr:hypothetical protein [Clostridium manihotivorum]QAA31771.1 hypothetical protein C1I91_09000 [Clostridium manihotivorum]
MKKIKALAKYELINLRRGKLIWIIGALYIFGIQQSVDSMRTSGKIFLSVVGLIRISWLPLNFIMVPLLLLIVMIGESSNEVFESLDITYKDIIKGKLLTAAVIDAILLATNMIVFLFFSIISHGTLGYILYESLGYIVNTLIYLVVCTCIGLFIGQVVNKLVYQMIGYLLVLLEFGFLCNFYKLQNQIFPLIDIKTFPGIFDVISYDKSYLYHNIFWLGVSFILVMISYLFVRSRYKKGGLGIKLVSIIIAGLLCAYLGISINSMKPDFYNIEERPDFEHLSAEHTYREGTFFSSSESGYYVDSYNMNIDIDNNLKNDCLINVKFNKSNIKSLEFGLYKSLNISKLEIDNKAIDFQRTNNSVILKLPRTYKSGESIQLRISYDGKINLTWSNGENMFFVRNNSLFLADVFEWYPKLNDSNEKNFEVNVKYASKNKIYSNLNELSKNGSHTFMGKDIEMFLISGNISERKYKDYLFIGNQEYIKNNDQCDELIDYLKKTNIDTKKVILSPFIPGLSKMDKPYDGAFLWPSHD